MKSWKTTVGGVLAAIGAWASNQGTPWWLYKAGPLLSGIGLVFLGASARDNNVPSEAVKSATTAAERIKGDTQHIQNQPPGK